MNQSQSEVPRFTRVCGRVDLEFDVGGEVDFDRGHRRIGLCA